MVNAGKSAKREVRLKETLDIAAVRDLHAELKVALDGGNSLSLDGSEVVRIDTASLQMLAAMFAHADRHERDIALRSPSETLVQTAALLGVNEYIGLKLKENN